MGPKPAYMSTVQCSKTSKANTVPLLLDAAWFDTANVGALITRLTEGVDKVEAGVGEKAGLFVQNLFVFIGGTVISLVKNWELALVSAAFFPLVGGSFAAVGFVVRKLSAEERAAYSRANGIAGEVLGAVKTIFAGG
ncbi:ATP binding cassette sub family B [Echinococcus multilocularis]|uniref:ATP binding cassette sub family B n=1 Tax=Echinococcus multilocularis TaxID=6211 RepID=A0A087VZW2_ECHMU|nr:ATP binding cassette sub family B [Echinococcus multilocularis]